MLLPTTMRGRRTGGAAWEKGAPDKVQGCGPDIRCLNVQHLLGVVRSGGEADPTKESPSTAKYGKSHQYFRKNKLLPHIAHQGKQYCRSEEAEDEKHKEAGRRPPDGGEGHFQDPD